MIPLEVAFTSNHLSIESSGVARAKRRLLGLRFTISLLTSSAFGPDNLTGTEGAPGCGEPSSKFEVRTEKGQHPAQRKAGKARV
jgi:hypothetical protein